MPLTDIAIRNAKPQAKHYKLYDEKGMYILIKEAGKYFHLDYRFQGKRKTISLGFADTAKQLMMGHDSI